MMVVKQYPEIYKTLYRGVRAGVSAGIATVLLLKLDLSNPQEVLRVVLMAFGTGFLVAFGKWAREFLDAKFGYDANSLVAKTMVV